MLGEICGRAADGGEIEAAVLLAGFAHRGGAVTLGQHDHRAASGLKVVNEGIHPSRGGGAEGAGGVALWRLGGTRVIDRVVLEIVWQPLPSLQPLAQFAV